jgi:hypothetical protein
LPFAAAFPISLMKRALTASVRPTSAWSSVRPRVRRASACRKANSQPLSEVLRTYRDSIE